MKKKKTRAVYFDCNGKGKETYNILFKTMKSYQIDEKLLSAVLKIFDENIRKLKMIDDHNYELVYNNMVMILSDKELINILSSGTTKGMLLYIMMVASLKNGFDLIIDEIENHFHKTLVENMISLYKDKYVNRHNAALIFTTHYCEVLDLFNRQDNIWVCRADNKVSFDNMYEKFSVRSELMKSKQFYSNTFRTAINYGDLMNLKKELM